MPGMMDTPMRTRFAPSPTGRLHAGNLRTALFNLLLARRHGGEFLLRVEDSDAQRDQPPAMEIIQHDLRWLGIDWDAGPGLGQPEAEWRQSARRAVYDQAIETLLAGGHAYPCFCTRDRLAALRARQRQAGEPPRYDGCCARLDADEAQRRLAAGEAAAIRLRLPDAGRIGFDDLVGGAQSFAFASLGDPVIRRADGSAAFLLANAVDDARMGITAVIRGEDHLSNTPAQLVLLEALGLTPPRYGHVGLVVDTTGAPLSKRRGAASVGALASQGYRPAAIVNYLARLGCSLESDQLLDIPALAAQFDPGRISRGPARFDSAQLDHWQALAMADVSDAELLAMLETLPVPADQAPRLLQLVRPNLLRVADVADWARRLCDPGFDVLRPADEPGDAAHRAADIVRDTPPGFFAATQAALEAQPSTDWGTLRPALEAATGCRGARLMKPLRQALTGYGHGPAIGDIIAFMPAEIRRRRLARAAELATAGADPDA